MLDTNLFLEKLIHKGFSHLCVVPCSFAKSIINAVINQNGGLEYVPCASEAVACSVASGLRMAGKRPLVIIQASGITNMGSCITSLLKPYGLRFPIIVSWRTYNQGDSEIQHAHLATKLPDLVSAYGYQGDILNSENEDIAVNQVVSCESSDTIILLNKNTFSQIPLASERCLDLSRYPRRSEYLKVLNSRYGKSDILFIGTTGNTAREMYSMMPDTSNFYMAGNMGGALSLGLGAAKAGKRVIVCGGDAEFVMHLGALTTTGRYGNDIDVSYFVFDNESNKSTGGQRTFQEHLDYLTLAASCGAETYGTTVESVNDFEKMLKRADNSGALFFSHVKASYDESMVRPKAEEIINSKSSFQV